MQKLQLTKKYNRYPEYKDSGVEWLGEIPAGWETEKLKFFSEISLGKMLQNDDKNGDFFKSYLCAQNIQWEKIDTSTVKEMWFSRNELSKHRIKKGDLLVSEGGEVGRTAIWNDEIEECYVQNSINRVSVKSDRINSTFLMYAFEGLGEMGIFNLLVNRVSIAHLTSEKLKEVEFIIPNKTIQDTLAAYLDEKVSVIDRTIEGKKKLIDLLREKRTAVINQAVTKGLDKNAEMIESGVDWIGKIPAGWKIEKLKFIAPQKNLKISAGSATGKYVGLENIESGTGKFVNTVQDIEPESILNIFSDGDVLFGKLRPYLAKVFAPNFNGVSTGELLCLVPHKQKVVQKFLAYRLISQDFIKLVDDSTYGSKMPRANWEFIGNQMIAFPSLLDQDKIVKSLDEETELFTKIIKTVEKSIETLQEFKSSLISHVVTGKVKV